LRGGFEAWRTLDYPLIDYIEPEAAQALTTPIHTAKTSPTAA
jgi:hypothetical protein